MFSFVKNAGTAAWKNPAYLEDATVFDQRITEGVIREILIAETQPTAERLGDEREKQVQDETKETFGSGKYLFLSLKFVCLDLRSQNSMIEVFCYKYISFLCLV